MQQHDTERDLGGDQQARACRRRALALPATTAAQLVERGEPRRHHDRRRPEQQRHRECRPAVAVSTGRLSSGAGSRATEAPASVVNASRPSRARTTPSTPAQPPTSRHSIRSWIASCRRVAPMAERIASSRRRCASRASSRPPTFAQATSKTNATAATAPASFVARRPPPRREGRRRRDRARSRRTPRAGARSAVRSHEPLRPLPPVRLPGATDPACAGSTGRAVCRAGRR